MNTEKGFEINTGDYTVKAYLYEGKWCFRYGRTDGMPPKAKDYPAIWSALVHLMNTVKGESA
jgi:hypothetical protein